MPKIHKVERIARQRYWHRLEPGRNWLCRARFQRHRCQRCPTPYPRDSQVGGIKHELIPPPSRGESRGKAQPAFVDGVIWRSWATAVRGVVRHADRSEDFEGPELSMRAPAQIGDWRPASLSSQDFPPGKSGPDPRRSLRRISRRIPLQTAPLVPTRTGWFHLTPPSRENARLLLRYLYRGGAKPGLTLILANIGR